MIQIKSTINFNGRKIGDLIGGKGSGGIAKKIAKESSLGLVQSYVIGGQFLQDVGIRGVERIKLRTRQGTDAEGKSFQQYSKRYLAQKKKYGRYRGKVDLYLSGAMLNAVDFFAGSTPLHGAIRVRDFTLPGRKISSGELARVHTLGEGKMPKRPFFAWRQGSQEDQKLRTQARALLMRALRARQRAAYGVSTFTSGKNVGTELT